MDKNKKAPKRVFFVLIVFVIALILASVLYFRFRSPELKAEGYLLLCSPNSDGSLVLLNASTGQVEPTGAYGYRACFAGSSDKFLIESVDLIRCFDEKTGSDVWTYEIPGNSSSSAFEFAYAGSSFVSIVASDQLQLINMDTDEKTIVRENKGLGRRHGWSADGKTVYYSVFDAQGGKIYKYNVDSCEEVYLFDGGSPSVSADGSRIAFIRNSALVVKDLVTEKEWTYHRFGGLNTDYCISPDGKYVAIVTEQLPNFLANTVLIWDFASNQTLTLLKDYPCGQCFGLDWFEQ